MAIFAVCTLTRVPGDVPVTCIPLSELQTPPYRGGDREILVIEGLLASDTERSLERHPY